MAGSRFDCRKRDIPSIGRKYIRFFKFSSINNGADGKEKAVISKILQLHKSNWNN